jgi:ribonucleoside-diphosphate reductase alpha chain
MTGVSYATSAEMAKELGPFPGYKKNAGAHAAGDPQPPPRRATAKAEGYEALAVTPVPLGSRQRCKQVEIVERAKGRLGQALELGELTASATRQTTGGGADRHHRPRDGLRHHRHRARLCAGKFKKLAGGGYWKIINRAVPRGAARARLPRSDIAEIEAYAVGHRLALQRAAINVFT